MNKATVKYFAKLLFGVAIILFIIGKIDWATFKDLVKKADPVLLFFAFVLLIVERVWAVFKWRVLLSVRSSSTNNVPMWNLFCIYSIGAFWGMFLPSSLSTDVVRGYYLHKEIKDSAFSAASVIVDRMLGLFSLLFLCIISILIFGSVLGQRATMLVLILSAIAIVAAVVAHLDVVPDYLEKRFTFFSTKPIGKQLLSMHRTFLSFKKYPLLISRSFIYSLILQLIRIFTIYVTARAFGVEAELIKFFLVVPATVIIIMVPVSIGGLGVREGSFVGLFSLVGVAVTESFAISVTNSIMVTLIALFGGFVYLAYRNELKEDLDGK